MNAADIAVALGEEMCEAAAGAVDARCTTAGVSRCITAKAPNAFRASANPEQAR
jgi:hypothetical protein